MFCQILQICNLEECDEERCCMEFLKNKHNPLLMGGLFCLFYFFGDARASAAFSINTGLYSVPTAYEKDIENALEGMQTVFKKLEERDLKGAVVAIRRVDALLQNIEKHLKDQAYMDDLLFIRQVRGFFRFLLSKTQSFFSPMTFNDYKNIETRIDRVLDNYKKMKEENPLSDTASDTFYEYFQDLKANVLPQLERVAWEESKKVRLKSLLKKSKIFRVTESFLKNKQFEFARKKVLKTVLFYDRQGKLRKESNEKKLLSSIYGFDLYALWKSFDAMSKNFYAQRPNLEKDINAFNDLIMQENAKAIVYPELAYILSFCKDFTDKMNTGLSQFPAALFDINSSRLLMLKNKFEELISEGAKIMANKKLLKEIKVPLEQQLSEAYKRYNNIAFWVAYIQFLRTFFAETIILQSHSSSEPKKTVALSHADEQDPEGWEFEEEEDE